MGKATIPAGKVKIPAGKIRIPMGNARIPAGIAEIPLGKATIELTTSPNVIWVDLSKMNLERGAAVMVLNPDNVDLSGDVTDKFQKAEKPPY